jgi:Taurine catabolism dioxygenase TauD, TfdA family
MNAHCTFEGLGQLSRNEINVLSPQDAPANLIQTLDRKGWCVMPQAADSLQGFKRFVSSLNVPIAEKYGDLPRSGAPDVFRTTPYPPEEDLLFHNEASHTPHVPRYLFFYCKRAAETGGSTPISDGALALALLDTTIAGALRQHGLIYRRRFVEGLDVAWQDYFDTQDPTEVERHCRASGLVSSWTAEGVLQVDYATLAIGCLPDGRQSMFHQVALHHPTFLAPEIREYFSNYDPQGCTPRNVLLGDGTLLSDEWAQAIVGAQNRAGQYFAWESGDILALDNRICAHGRMRFSGLRENYVIMSALEIVENVWSDGS